MKKLFLCILVCASLIACGKKEGVVDDRTSSPSSERNVSKPIIEFVKERNICFAYSTYTYNTLVEVDCTKAGL